MDLLNFQRLLEFFSDIPEKKGYFAKLENQK
jgi:hypothetical protein